MEANKGIGIETARQLLQAGTVEDAEKRIVKYALTGKDGVTGKFFCEEINPETGEIPW